MYFSIEEKKLRAYYVNLSFNEFHIKCFVKNHHKNPFFVFIFRNERSEILFKNKFEIFFYWLNYFAKNYFRKYIFF